MRRATKLGTDEPTLPSTGKAAGRAGSVAWPSPPCSASRPGLPFAVTRGNLASARKVLPQVPVPINHRGDAPAALGRRTKR